MLTGKELEAVDNWRFNARMAEPGSGGARAPEAGLGGRGLLLADGSAKSQDFGVTDGASKRQESGAD